jgi:hypothetical protein
VVGVLESKFRCPNCGHWCVWSDAGPAWVCSKRGGCGNEYMRDGAWDAAAPAQVRSGTHEAATAAEAGSPQPVGNPGESVARMTRRVAALAALRAIAQSREAQPVRAAMYARVFAALPEREVCELVVVLSENLENGPEAAANWHAVL